MDSVAAGSRSGGRRERFGFYKVSIEPDSTLTSRTRLDLNAGRKGLVLDTAGSLPSVGGPFWLVGGGVGWVNMGKAEKWSPLYPSDRGS